MDTFFKDEVRSFQLRFERILRKLSTIQLYKWVNSGDHVKDSQAGDLTILILLVVCAFLFWL